MKRRHFIGGLGGAAALSACQPQAGTGPSTQASAERFSWKLVTTWPPNFPGLGTGVNTLVRYIEAMSAGRIQIQVYAANELIPALEVFDAVSRGTAEMGHGAAYYWRGQSEAAQFFCSIPFGMTAHEMNGWLYYGGGLDLWRETYEPFNLMPFPAGNTGVQMGGWFNKRIDSLEDLQGLKMRIPGVGGEALRLAGGTPVTLAGSEIFTALQTGSIDATEWVGPYNDLAMGLHQAARYYYYPGWQEPGPTLECIINTEAWNSLPEDLQAIVEVACQATNQDMTSEYMARNAAALRQLSQNPDVEILRFPEAVLDSLAELTLEVVEGLAADDERVARVWQSYRTFLEESATWQRVSEQAYLATRA
ncbi:MAG: TRAP transporter substrate-binding protein DctP [Gammaproteobacteria bacterium]|jgi:TRAP-type mannitol/chloroaromatic compound transport system substrate-binding protein